MDMNRQEFLTGLSQLLADIPEAERQEALDYYNSYFDDAGPENEAMVIQELGGTPDKAAASIKAELRSGKTSRRNYGEYTEQGYRDTRIPNTDQMPQPVPRPEKENSRKFQSDNSRMTKIILIALILIVTSSIWLGIIGGLFGAVFGLLGGLLSLIAGLGGAVFSMIVGGIALTFTGLVKCAANPPVGLLTSGLGMILLAVGILLLILIVWLLKNLVPKLVRWLRDGFWKLLDWCKTKWEFFKGKE